MQSSFSELIYGTGLALYHLSIGANGWLIPYAVRRKLPYFALFLGVTMVRWVVNLPSIWTGNLALYSALYWWGRPFYVLAIGLVLSELGDWKRALYWAAVMAGALEMALMIVHSDVTLDALGNVDRIFAAAIATGFLLFAVFGSGRQKWIASGFAIASVFEAAVNVLPVQQYGHALRMVPVFSYAVGLGVWLRYFSKEHAHGVD